MQMTSPISDESQLTHRQRNLSTRLREIESQMTTLQRERLSIKSELERIYPSARTPLPPAPKERGVVLSVFNYESQGYTATVQAATTSNKALSSLSDVEALILILCKQPQDARKLMNYAPLKQLVNRPSARLHRLIRSGHIAIQFTKVGPA